MNATSSNRMVCFHLGEIEFNLTTAVAVIAIISASVNLFCSLLATLGNMIIIYVMITKKTLHTASNLLLTSLCCSDLIVGVLVQPLFTVLRSHEINDIHLCTVKKVYGFTAFYSGILTVMMIGYISIDRAIAVSYPLRYRAKDLKPIYLRIIIAQWLATGIGLSLVYAELLQADILFKFTMVLWSVTFSVIVVCYVKVSRAARARRKRITHMIREQQGTEVLAQRRKNKTTLIIVSVYFLCYVPKLVHKTAAYLGADGSDYLYAAKLTETVLYMNSSLNPCIYFYRTRRIREAIFEVLHSLLDVVISRISYMEKVSDNVENGQSFRSTLATNGSAKV